MLFDFARPPPDISLDILEKGQHPAQQRLIFEELLAHNLAMQKVRLGTAVFSVAIAVSNRFEATFSCIFAFSTNKCPK